MPRLPAGLALAVLALAYLAHIGDRLRLGLRRSVRPVFPRARLLLAAGDRARGRTGAVLRRRRVVLVPRRPSASMASPWLASRVGGGLDVALEEQDPIVRSTGRGVRAR